MPQALARPMRRRSSCMRSSERAISRPPVRVNVPMSSNSWIESIDQIEVCREWSTANVKELAWPVEPPGLGSGPLSTWTMSRQPRRARCQARPLPTMPAPTITTRAWEGNSLIHLLLCGVARVKPDDRPEVRPCGRASTMVHANGTLTSPVSPSTRSDAAAATRFRASDNQGAERTWEQPGHRPDQRPGAGASHPPRPDPERRARGGRDLLGGCARAGHGRLRDAGA